MAEIDVTIKVLSPIHLSSGQADVTVDSEIIHDEFGFPYFPAKRFKGLLYESALEIFEMFELSGLDTQNLSTIEKIFHRHSSSNVQLIVPNFFIHPADKYQKFCAEWKYLLTTYPEIFTAADILNTYTSVRYQTKLEEGIAADGSLHNMRVLDAGTNFFGRMTLINDDKKILNLLALAIKNLSSAGLKRNRGFGMIECTAKIDNKPTDELVKKILREGDLNYAQAKNFPQNTVAAGVVVREQLDRHDGNASGNKRLNNSRNTGNAVCQSKKNRRRGSR